MSEDQRQQIESYRSGLYCFFYRRTRDHHTIEDLCQETFLKVLSAWKTYDPSQPLRPWVASIAFNAYRDWRRKEDRHPTQPHEDLDCYPDHRYYSSPEDISGIVREKVSTLPPSQSRVVLERLAGKTYTVIAQESCMAVGTIKVHAYRARMTLKKSEKLRALSHSF